MSLESGLGVQSQLWAIVLAGGEGVRLRPLVRRLYGDDRPKQFAALMGSRSLLRQTLDRIRPIVPPDRTVVVTHQRHDRYLAAALDGAAVGRVLAQPEDRGTAAGVLLPIHWISWQDPDALVAVFPSDHFILEERVFMDHVADVADVVCQHPGWMVLLGATPTEPDPDYGWIEPGELMAWSPAGGPISRVRQFLEKPPAEAARACLEKGWVWNTFVFVAKASTLLEEASRLLPVLHERLSLILPFKDTKLERWALNQAYALAPKASFSRAVLERRPPSLLVSRVPRLTWSDWGTPQRVLKSLKEAGLHPPWLRESDVPAWDDGARCTDTTRRARAKPAEDT
ncbi:MAG TPA: sugar phosphate nucleotidyltransferase [Methylomirabilota bacterium]|jgi:mannose-1-phosphate guanylyltransferase|nr:sugar phosphate nucleotidyltransferase [Methylomirabilota bacterium]